MSAAPREWIKAGLPAGTYDLLARSLPASRLWSLLLEILDARAKARPISALTTQWDADRFVLPSSVDQRTLGEIDRHLLAAAEAFESIELSPVAPLGVSSAMGRSSQNRVLSALRGTEVVSDPTNVLALECARRLRGAPDAHVRLATSQRCVRAQEIPRVKGFTASFRIFCLASAGVERADHAFVVGALGEHIRVMLSALAGLDAHGFAFPDRRVTVFAAPDRVALGDRIASACGWPDVARRVLEHPYYNGLRYQISARSTDGEELPLIDGGAFDWVARLTSNRRAVFVASGLGSQVVAMRFVRS
ncbi:MAG TPA: hypothetical protein VH583_01345 [Vicinamibacterales bacterium]|jgi:hypothetical protein